MTEALAQRGFDVIPSQGNFVLATLPGTRYAKPVYEGMKARGVLVRFFDKHGLNDKLRITIGTPDENAAMLVALDASLLASA